MSQINENAALITPAVLKWAREKKGAQASEIAEYINLTEAEYLAVEGGTRQLTVSQLRNVSVFLLRPTAFFYLPAPPADSEVKKRFRARMEAIIEVEGSVSEEEVAGNLVFAYAGEANGETFPDDDQDKFRIVAILDTFAEEIVEPQSN